LIDLFQLTDYVMTVCRINDKEEINAQEMKRAKGKDTWIKHF